MSNVFSGVYTALITPFTEYNTVDYTSLERIVNYQIESGIDGLVPCGTSGESPTLSHEEHNRVIRQTIKFASGRVPVIAGTGSNATSEAISLSQRAEDDGVDAILLVNPYYNKPTQKGMYLHFKAVADSVSIPCILYNIKGRCGVNLETDTLIKLANDCSNIVAVKEASGDLVQMEDVIKRGGNGVVSVASNLFPLQMKKMISSALSGDLESAEKYNSWFAEFFKVCFIETNPIPIKTAMAAMGFCKDIFRLPLCNPDDDHKKLIVECVNRMMNDIKEGKDGNN